MPRSVLKATRAGFCGRAAAPEKLGCGPTCDSGSSGCQPASTSNMRAMSATLRAIGPSTDSGLNGCFEVRGTMPGLGRSPVVEQKLDGVRMLPPKSPPVASHTCPDASAAAEPPEEPLALMRKSHGIERRAEHVVEGVAAGGELGQVGFADHDRAVRLQPLHHHVGRRRDAVGVDARARGAAHARDVGAVLHRDRQAVQVMRRHIRPLLLHDALRVLAGAVVARRHDRVDLRVGRLDARHGHVDQLERRYFAALEQVHGLGRRQSPQLLHHRSPWYSATSKPDCTAGIGLIMRLHEIRAHS